MKVPKLVGLLVRARPGAAQALQALPLTPLFRNAKSSLGIAGEEWLHMAAPAEAEGAWDTAHALVGGDFGAAPGVTFVEPDLEQEFLAFEERDDPGLAARGGRGVFDPQDDSLPTGPEFAWHLRTEYAQLKAARELSGYGAGATIVHIDTGYDPKHATCPVSLDKDYAWDFIANAAGAADPDVHIGILKNGGHGTGTLSILAGARVGELNDFLGAAPRARVIPFRIADSVVLFRTSALARAIDRAIRPTRADGADPLPPADVISMSMGGLASAAWAEAVNAAYEQGVCLVTAAGNNFSIGIGAFPTRFIVYPARFRRVLAACGVMANRSSYSGLPLGRMQGCYGPASKMATALSAFTPNMPWAEIGSTSIVDMNGQGTSSATPQIAGTAALWIAKHRAELDKLPNRWQRVEAVRRALFSSASRSSPEISDKLGNGILQAADALQVGVASDLPMTPPDDARFAFFRALTGLGLAPGDPRTAMFELEAAQLVQQPMGPQQINPFEELVPDPDAPPATMPDETKRNVLAALRDHPRISQALRKHLDSALSSLSKEQVQVPPAPPVSPQTAIALRRSATRLYTPPTPHQRRLRGYSFDPSVKLRMETAAISEVTFRVPWEKDLVPGPRGEYLEVIDYDPASRAFYAPVDLDHPHLLAQDGLAPSEGNPQFHQQMVYAVASTTIAHFEAALGRRALWAPRPPPPENPRDDSQYVQRLRIYPHAFRNANAYYSPAKKALLFGYFRASATDPGEHLPGGVVFSCLSHDIVAHETAHALLDGMHRRFSEGTTPDPRAFHEAFADVVALMQHFTFPEILRVQIAQTRGDLRTQQNLMGQMASEFGLALGMHGALRSYIGQQANPSQYLASEEPHARGAVLVAAIFEAFLMVYEARTRDLLRIATGGTGVLPSGALHPDLVNRLADESARAAAHVLRICIRGLDYCPPVDLTFGEYLRALVTADRDLVPNDRFDYRVAFIDSFRRRGIYPPNMRTLSEDSLLWRGPEDQERKPSPVLVKSIQLLREDVKRFHFAQSRREIFHLSRNMRMRLHLWLEEHLKRDDVGPQDAAFLGLGQSDRFEIHSARFANRVGPEGSLLSQFVFELLQRPKAGGERGCTLIIDVSGLQIRYVIRKEVLSAGAKPPAPSTWATYFGAAGAAFGAAEPFAVLHRDSGRET